MSTFLCRNSEKSGTMFRFSWFFVKKRDLKGLSFCVDELKKNKKKLMRYGISFPLHHSNMHGQIKPRCLSVSAH